MSSDLDRCPNAKCQHYRGNHNANGCKVCGCGWDGGELLTDDPATMNAVGSETGRVFRRAPDSVLDAARSFDVTSHRAIIADRLRTANRGLTSIEAAALLPATRQGGQQVSNRSSSRLGELWEEGKAAVSRDRGVCVLGECHRHDKPGTVHRPTDPCERHGKPIRRDGANVWQWVAG